MSIPISGSIASAASVLTPGMTVSISVATRKGSTFADLHIDRRDGRIPSIEIVQMQPQHKAMICRHPAA
jgi:hypothetical protein